MVTNSKITKERATIMIGEIYKCSATPTKKGAINFPACPMNSMQPIEVD